ncbi:MAG: heat-inducible transcriptional repressor HrcA [Clostridiales Family XIII bacterium]|jgi:heat-inducible transcriptional repressor|nr:heat-inducible transcriptional repressor HrcA [Clostridiales Family XIII bacterium]
MELTERKLKILQAIISDFIASAEPVGSRTLSKKYGMGISPATIRNEMSDLEDLGYLTHPHTSAGRVPSDRAYRLYVDYLMSKADLTEEEKRTISEQLASNITELDGIIQRAANVLSEITSLTSFALTPKQDANVLKYVNILPADEETVVIMIVAESGKIKNAALKLRVPYTEDSLNLLAKALTYNYRGKTISDILTMDIIRSFETDIEAMSRLAASIMPSFMDTLESMLDVNLYMDGLTNIFTIPEYNNIDKARMFLEMVQKKKRLMEVLVNRDDGVIITIGNENKADLMQDCSVITATYHINGKLVGKLGVIGPTRMNYDKVTSVVEYMTDNLNNVFKAP